MVAVSVELLPPSKVADRVTSEVAGSVQGFATVIVCGVSIAVKVRLASAAGSIEPLLGVNRTVSLIVPTVSPPLVIIRSNCTGSQPEAGKLAGSFWVTDIAKSGWGSGVAGMQLSGRLALAVSELAAVVLP